MQESPFRRIEILDGRNKTAADKWTEVMAKVVEIRKGFNIA